MKLYIVLYSCPSGKGSCIFIRFKDIDECPNLKKGSHVTQTTPPLRVNFLCLCWYFVMYINVPTTKFEVCIFTVVESFDVENIVTLKSGLGVTQDHWKWYHLKACVGSYQLSVLKIYSACPNFV